MVLIDNFLHPKSTQLVILGGISSFSPVAKARSTEGTFFILG